MKQRRQAGPDPGRELGFQLRAIRKDLDPLAWSLHTVGAQ